MAKQYKKDYRNYISSDDEMCVKNDFELEDHLVLRLPETEAKILREGILNGNLANGNLSVSLKIENEFRKTEVRFENRVLYGKVVDLPTITEVLKTVDNINCCKISDISKMLNFEDNLSTEKITPDPQTDMSEYLYPHGLTPPLRNARKRNIRQNFIFKEVRALLCRDRTAICSELHFVDENEATFQERPENCQNQEKNQLEANQGEESDETYDSEDEENINEAKEQIDEESEAGNETEEDDDIESRDMAYENEMFMENDKIEIDEDENENASYLEDESGEGDLIEDNAGYDQFEGNDMDEGSKEKYQPQVNEKDDPSEQDVQRGEKYQSESNYQIEVNVEADLSDQEDQIGETEEENQIEKNKIDADVNDDQSDKEYQIKVTVEDIQLEEYVTNSEKENEAVEKNASYVIEKERSEKLNKLQQKLYEFKMEYKENLKNTKFIDNPTLKKRFENYRADLEGRMMECEKEIESLKIFDKPLI